MKFLANIGKDAMDVGAGIAGGSVGRVITNKVGEKIPVIGSNAKLRPAGAFLAGLLIMGNTKGIIREGGRGMAIVAGTDVLSGYVPMVKAEAIGDDLENAGKQLADELQDRLNDDVNDGNKAVNDDVNDGNKAVNDEMNEEVSGNDDDL